MESEISSEITNEHVKCQIKNKTNDNRKNRNFKSNQDYLNNIGRGPTIIIDCDYDDKLSDRNIKSLVVQLSISYSCIRKSKIPLKMIICGASQRLKQGLYKTLAESWLGVEILSDKVNKVVSDRYSDNNSNYEIIYLSADSNNVLMSKQDKDEYENSPNQGFNNKQIFIIGGIIDRNKYKNISKLRAEEFNIKTARLPIIESGMALCSNQVLAVNHVVECIVKYNENCNWYTTFNSILPKRKKDNTN
ncbi:tRNA (Guanine-1)-methyltransferase family protein [Cryptosporidium meleagridis]|uniref:tRNA (guanine(9)-N(1))-methyltransferase n=1 Tax=Cryptosporidium meleagridis TaxID=93969 RepID=A0A2P4Z1E2_9CRYT|nr:tRNA (Guanine-1)-methyltransferase family protein [Cryptosporidium meleagridis]